jgi:hypothetical protein
MLIMISIKNGNIYTRGGNRAGWVGSGLCRVGSGQVESARLLGHRSDRVGSGWVSNHIVSGHFRFRV